MNEMIWVAEPTLKGLVLRQTSATNKDVTVRAIHNMELTQAQAAMLLQAERFGRNRKSVIASRKGRQWLKKQL